MEAVEEGIREGTAWVQAHKGYHMEASLTILAQRSGTPKESLQSAKLAVKLAKRPQSLITGFDLAGDESKYSVERHHKALEYIRQRGTPYGIGLTVMLVKPNLLEKSLVWIPLERRFNMGQTDWAMHFV